MSLPVELLSQIVCCLGGDIHTLYSCTLVCQAFHATATPLLYKQIHVSPPKTGLAWQALEDMPGRRPFATSRLPSHTGYVEEFILDGYITKVRSSRRTPVPIVEKIPSALCMWPNLRKVTITPYKVTGNAIHDIVRALKLCKTLKSLTINEFVMKEEIMPELAQLVGLEEVILLGPTGALFVTICGWLSHMQNTILTLNLLGNCGSLTPGILRRLTPYLSHIEDLAIGLSYSLTHTDVFVCLSQLPRLKRLQLQYYHQARLPQDPQLRSLRSLTILHSPLLYKKEADDLSALIRRIASSSRLKTLQTVTPDYSGPSLCFDGLITHLANRHRKTLTALRMPSAHARGPTLQVLLSNCLSLREVALNITFNTLKSLPTMSAGSSLRTVAFSVCDHPYLLIDVNNAKKIFDRVPQLRFITVNHVTWKGEWMLGTQGTTSPDFVVSLVKYGEIATRNNTSH